MQCIACLMVILIPPSLSRKVFQPMYSPLWKLGRNPPNSIQLTLGANVLERLVQKLDRGIEIVPVCMYVCMYVPKWLFSKLRVGLHHCVEAMKESVSATISGYHGRRQAELQGADYSRFSLTCTTHDDCNAYACSRCA